MPSRCITEGYYATESLKKQYNINVLEIKIEEAAAAVKGDDFACTALAYDSGAACLWVCHLSVFAQAAGKGPVQHVKEHKQWLQPRTHLFAACSPPACLKTCFPRSAPLQPSRSLPSSACLRHLAYLPSSPHAVSWVGARKQAVGGCSASRHLGVMRALEPASAPSRVGGALSHVLPRQPPAHCALPSSLCCRCDTSEEGQ